MIIHKSFRYRIYPSSEQMSRMRRWQDALRFLWNLANEQRLIGLSRPRGERRSVTDFDQMRDLTELRAELPWLADVPYDVCAQLLVELHNAWQRCFKRLAKRPAWKRKRYKGLCMCEPRSKSWSIDGSNLLFPKIGSIRCALHRDLEGKPRTCTIHRDGDQWFASVVCKIEVPDPPTRTEPVVALDRGVVNIVGDSDGRLVRNPKHLEAELARLARVQRTVARRKKGSKNREKAQLRVMRLHRKVRRQRDHALHVLSHGYAKSHGTVVIENLPINNMVRAARVLARSVFGAGWGKLGVMLRYKLAWSGGQLVEVPAAYSSQTCSVCGCVDPGSRPSQDVFRCVSCGHTEHADLNAPKVLKQRFRAVEPTVTGCGGSANGRPVKQQLRAVRRGKRRDVIHASPLQWLQKSSVGL